MKNVKDYNKENKKRVPGDIKTSLRNGVILYAHEFEDFML